jgi:hypothetical protein
MGKVMGTFRAGLPSARLRVTSSANSRPVPAGNPWARREILGPLASQAFGQIKTGRVALHVGAQGHDHSPSRPAQAGFQFGQAQVLRLHAIERRNLPAQHVIFAAETARFFQGKNVQRTLDHAQRSVPSRAWIGANGASARPRLMPRKPRRRGFFRGPEPSIWARRRTESASLCARCRGQPFAAVRGPMPGRRQSSSLNVAMAVRAAARVTSFRAN